MSAAHMISCKTLAANVSFKCLWERGEVDDVGKKNRIWTVLSVQLDEFLKWIRVIIFVYDASSGSLIVNDK